jgi:hypothetical protein
MLLMKGRCEFGFTRLTPSLTEGGSSHEMPHSVVVHHVYCGAPYRQGCARWLRRWCGFEWRAWRILLRPVIGHRLAGMKGEVVVK